MVYFRFVVFLVSNTQVDSKLLTDYVLDVNGVEK